MGYKRKPKINYTRLAIMILGIVALIAVVVVVIIGAKDLALKLIGGGDNTSEVSGNKVEEFKYTDIEEGQIISPYGAIYDVENARMVAGRRTDAKIYPASMTKLMTLLIAVDTIDTLDRQFIISQDIVDYATAGNFVTAGFKVGETVTARDMLYGLILQSGADCAEGIARMVAGSQASFARLMNAKAQEIGLTNTNFTNALGAHDANHYTTVEDMVKLFDYVMQNEVCKEVLSSRIYTTTATWAHSTGIAMDNHAFTNLEKDSADVEGKDSVTITAVKAGFTDQAGRCLMSYANKGDRHYIVVTAMAGSNKDAVIDAYKLFSTFAK